MAHVARHRRALKGEVAFPIHLAQGEDSVPLARAGQPECSRCRGIIRAAVAHGVRVQRVRGVPARRRRVPRRPILRNCLRTFARSNIVEEPGDSRGPHAPIGWPGF